MGNSQVKTKKLRPKGKWKVASTNAVGKTDHTRNGFVKTSFLKIILKDISREKLITIEKTFFMFSTRRQYRRPNYAEFAKKTYAISQFVADILPVPISPNLSISPNLPISPICLNLYLQILCRRHE